MSGWMRGGDMERREKEKGRGQIRTSISEQKGQTQKVRPTSATIHDAQFDGSGNVQAQMSGRHRRNAQKRWSDAHHNPMFLALQWSLPHQNCGNCAVFGLGINYELWIFSWEIRNFNTSNSDKLWNFLIFFIVFKTNFIVWRAGSPDFPLDKYFYQYPC